MCILNLSFQPWQYKSGHCKTPPHHALHHHPPSPSTLSLIQLITTAERHQQAITARWECDTFHKSLSWKIAFLYPAWDCVSRKKKKNTHTLLHAHTKQKSSDFSCRLCSHTFIHERGVQSEMHAPWHGRVCQTERSSFCCFVLIHTPSLLYFSVPAALKSWQGNSVVWWKCYIGTFKLKSYTS